MTQTAAAALSVNYGNHCDCSDGDSNADFGACLEALPLNLRNIVVSDGGGGASFFVSDFERIFSHFADVSLDFGVIPKHDRDTGFFTDAEAQNLRMRLLGELSLGACF